MLNEYDVVIAKKDLGLQVLTGSRGTVLVCFDDDDYEVEFIDDKGDSLEVLTVSGADLNASEK